MLQLLLVSLEDGMWLAKILIQEDNQIKQKSITIYHELFKEK